MEKIIAKIDEQELSTREYILSGLVLLLGGLLLGILISPKGKRIIGSNNGNNNSGIGTNEVHDEE